jgi:solute carrier family 25 (mitochondrial carnitine/acylcarnitine transporter), member 20/29
VTCLQLAGGLSGMAYWTAFFPADTVKSCMQTEPALAQKGFFATFGHIYRTHGLRALYSVRYMSISQSLSCTA